MLFWVKLEPNHKFGLESNATYLKDLNIPLYHDYIYNITEFLKCSSTDILDCFLWNFVVFLFCLSYLITLSALFHHLYQEMLHACIDS